MAYTGHGHYIIGSKKVGKPPSRTSRCGGPRMCNACKDDSKLYWDKFEVIEKPKENSMEVVVLGDAIRQKKARTIVENYIVDGLPDDKKSIKIEAYVLRLTRVGDDWKSILTCNVDELLYEVVYLSKVKAARITVYSPVDAVTIQDDVD